MMRLPPPPEEPTPVVERGLELTFQAGFGARVSGGANSEGRFQGVALVRPFLGLGLGALADVGTQASIDSAGFKGDWSDWAVLGVVSWRLPIDRYEIEPWVAGGVERSVMSGLQNQVSRTEHATLAALRGGVWARLRLGRFGIGASLDVESTQGTPTYTKPDQARAVVFEVPSFGVVAGVIIAADLAP
jgi:hypothetical protein